MTDFNGHTDLASTTPPTAYPTPIGLGSSGDTIKTSYDADRHTLRRSTLGRRHNLQRFSYSNDPSGAIDSETDTPSSSLTPADYSYDPQNRVTQMTPGTNDAHDYSYDASGNLTTLPTGASTTYNHAGELTSSTLDDETSGYTYDKDGNRTSADVPAPSGLVAAYSFDDGSGTAVSDSSGEGNDGVLNDATWSTPGKDGDALSFYGSSDSKVTVPDSASLELAGSLTFEAWVKPEGAENWWESVLAKGDSYGLYGSSDDDYPDASLQFSGGTEAVGGSDSLPIDEWSFLAATYDGTTIRLYVNGSQVASEAQTGSLVGSTDDLLLGNNDSWNGFDGLIDDLRIYNSALTPAQLAVDMGTPVPAGSIAAPSGLVAAYLFDDGSGRRF